MKKRKTAVLTPIPTSPDGLTVGLDLGDRSSAYCILDRHGEVISERSVRTTPKEMTGTFSCMPQSRIALETGTHSPWISRFLSAMGHEVIVANGAACAPYCPEPPERRPDGCADVGTPGKS